MEESAWRPDVMDGVLTLCFSLLSRFLEVYDVRQIGIIVSALGRSSVKY